jgi:hypothetical protein
MHHNPSRLPLAFKAHSPSWVLSISPQNVLQIFRFNFNVFGELLRQWTFAKKENVMLY